MMKHLKPLVPVVLACLALGAGYAASLWRQARSGAALSYVLAPDADGVRVTLSVRTPFREATLRPVAYDLMLPMEEFAVLAEDGSPLPVETIPGEIALDAAAGTRLTRYRLAPPGGAFTVRYLARPPVFKAGGACAPVKRHALAGEALRAAPGSALFLVPDGPVRSLEVRCAGAGDLETLNRLPVQEALDRIAETLFLAGGIPAEGAPDGPFPRILVSPAWDAEERRRVAEWTASLCRALAREIGPPPPVTLAVLPPQGPDVLAVSDRSVAIQVSELNLRSGTGKLALAEGLALRWLGRSPEAAGADPAPGAWFPAGRAHLAACRALRAIGETWAGEEAVAAGFEARLDVPLAGPPPREPDLFTAWTAARRIKGACAAMLLDWEIGRLTAGGRSLRDLGNGDDIEEEAVALAGPGIRPFFDRWVRNADPLLYPFPFLARPDPLGAVAPLGDAPPALRLLLTGHTQAYLETCGCKMSQSGGIARRQTAFSAARRDGIPVLALDLGGFFPYATKPGELDALSEMEIRFCLDAMGRMGYAAAALGVPEVLHGRAFLEKMLRESQAPPVLSADLDLAPAASPWILARAGTRTIGLVGVTGDPARWEGAVRFDRTLSEIRPRESGTVAAAVRAARAAGAQHVFLLGSVSAELLDALHAAGAGPDLALDPGPHPLWSDVSGQKPPVWMGLHKGTLRARAPKGSHGLSILEIAWGDGPEPPRAALRTVDLDGTIPDDPEMRRHLDAFYAGLAGRPETWTSFEPLFPWDPESRGPFVGETTCRSCHPSQHDQWKGTRHADAMRILVQQHRNFNPKCVVCHVTGMGREGGYVLSPGKHPLENVQCEVCHGSGADHAAAPSRTNIRKTPPKRVCLECHNAEHSDAFEKRFPGAWKKVRH